MTEVSAYTCAQTPIHPYTHTPIHAYTHLPMFPHSTDLLKALTTACGTSLENLAGFIHQLAEGRNGLSLVYMHHADSLRTGTSYQNSSHISLRDHAEVRERGRGGERERGRGGEGERGGEREGEGERGREGGEGEGREKEGRGRIN